MSEYTDVIDALDTLRDAVIASRGNLSKAQPRKILDRLASISRKLTLYYHIPPSP